jgi:protease YdgD
MIKSVLAAAAGLLLLAGGAQAQQLDWPQGSTDAFSSRDYQRLLHQVTKPGANPVAGASAVAGDDSCRYANDNECDEPGLGTGACSAGTDRSDCWRLMAGVEDDSCQWANDGECDEPGFGTGACVQATDRTDCGPLIELRFRNDQCDTAFNGICEEPGVGNGACAERSDRADCIGRERPMSIQDHYFGNDDRVLMDTGVFPWSVVGYIEFDAGGTCTATLIGEDVLVTAAHCISEGGRIDAAGVFRTGENLPGGARSARVIDYLMDDDWDEAAFSAGDTLDGTDWALLRLDQPLGAELGYVGYEALVDDQGPRAALRAPIRQAGYSWDTGSNLSGNLDCRIIEVFDDNTMAHNCDTTRGDSGSPFMTERNGEWRIVATDSNFRSNPDGPFIYIAARSDRWAPMVEDFAAGRIGNGGLRAQGPGKPGKPEPIKK